MKVTEAFPSAFLKADDLKAQSTTVTVDSIDLESIGKDSKEKKLIIGFREKQKKLVCNKTNTTTISKTYGDELG